MDKVLIQNCYHPFSFPFTTLFLEEGYEVIGFGLADNEDTEKELQIGRNANFSECAELSEWNWSNEESYLIIINQLEEPVASRGWEEIVKKLKGINGQYLVMLPLVHTEDWRKEVKSIQEEMAEPSTHTFYYYLSSKEQTYSDLQELAKAMLMIAGVKL